MIDDIFKKPDPSKDETFFYMACTGKSEDDMTEMVNSLDHIEDAQILHTIFKKCEHHSVKILAGKKLYYNG